MSRNSITPARLVVGFLAGFLSVAIIVNGVIAILHALAPQTSRFSVLVPSQTHASGD